MAEWIIEIKDGKYPIGKWKELVRCKDCVRYDGQHCIMERMTARHGDFFCAYGEREEK